MNNLLFSARDGRVLSMMSQHIDRHRSMPSQGPCEATVIFIAGDAGTGKTMIQDALRYVPNISPVFMGSTNVSGMELRKVFTDQQLFANDHVVYSTTFQYLGRLTPDDWGQCMKILYEGAPAAVRTASYATPAEFYNAIWPSLRSVCIQIFQRQHKGVELIPASAYQKFRRVVAETVLAGQPKDTRREHAEAMAQILAVYPRSAVPDQLIFDTYVHDEAGRLTCSWYIINVGMYYTVHELYNTGMDKPTEVIVGSCTQQVSINSECIKGCSGGCSHEPLRINDSSMITMITQPCLLYDSGVFVKNNKHMRRTKTGDPDRSANLAIFRNCLETSEPIPADITKYMRTQTNVSREEFLKRKCVHLSGTHEECRKVLDADIVAPEDVVLCEETMTAVGGRWPNTLYGCTEGAGAMFKSANYSNPAWTKRVVYEPHSVMAKFKFKFEATRRKKYSEWSNIRKFYKNRPYKTTHTARSALRSIAGSWKGFLKDMGDIEDALEDNPALVSEMISAMASTLMHANVGDVQNIYERTMSKAAGIEELLQTFQDLKSLMASGVDGGHADIHHTCNSEERVPLTIPKGEHVYFLNREGRSLRGPCKVRKGETMVVTVYPVCTRSQSVGKYRTTKFRPGRGTKRKLEEEKEEEEVGVNDFSDGEGDVLEGRNLVREAALFCESLDKNDDDDDFTVLDIMPLKLNLVSTVAASQGSTITSKVYGEVRKKMPASDLIVMCTRNSNADDLSLYFADMEGKKDDDPEKGLCIIPLDQRTQNTIKILNVKSLRDTGVL